jgi:hypothetical protein
MADDAFLELPIDEQREILQTTATRLARSASVLEKDIWVCWALQALFSMPDAHPMAFKGGTSLSKVYGVIDRFSEDVDITLDYRAFEKKFDPFAKGLSRTKANQFSDRLKSYVREYANDFVVPYFNEAISRLPTAGLHTVEIDDSGEKIWVTYPSAVESSGEYIRSQVLVELGGRNVIDPSETHTVFPYVAELTEGLIYPTSEVVVLSPERTFWEKATLMHVECNRGKLRENAERLSRHWYDLVMLAEHPAGKSAINNRGLFEDVVRHKKVFFHTGYADYDSCLQGRLKLLPETDTLDSLRSDYEKMVRAGMMYSTPPGFDEIVESIRNLENRANNWA